MLWYNIPGLGLCAHVCKPRLVNVNSQQPSSLKTYCGLTIQDAVALNQANRYQYLPRLKILDLNGFDDIPGLGLDTIFMLFHKPWSALEELSLTDCCLTEEDGLALLDACRRGYLPRLTTLWMRGNYRLPDEIGKQLSQCIKTVYY